MNFFKILSKWKVKQNVTSHFTLGILSVREFLLVAQQQKNKIKKTLGSAFCRFHFAIQHRKSALCVHMEINVKKKRKTNLRKIVCTYKQDGTEAKDIRGVIDD